MSKYLVKKKGLIKASFFKGKGFCINQVKNLPNFYIFGANLHILKRSLRKKINLIRKFLCLKEFILKNINSFFAFKCIFKKKEKKERSKEKKEKRNKYILRISRVFSITRVFSIIRVFNNTRISRVFNNTRVFNISRIFSITRILSISRVLKLIKPLKTLKFLLRPRFLRDTGVLKNKEYIDNISKSLISRNLVFRIKSLWLILRSFKIRTKERGEIKEGV